jgi:hypothetical protein
MIQEGEPEALSLIIVTFLCIVIIIRLASRLRPSWVVQEREPEASPPPGAGLHPGEDEVEDGPLRGVRRRRVLAGGRALGVRGLPRGRTPKLRPVLRAPGPGGATHTHARPPYVSISISIHISIHMIVCFSGTCSQSARAATSSHTKAVPSASSPRTRRWETHTLVSRVPQELYVHIHNIMP